MQKKLIALIILIFCPCRILLAMAGDLDDRTESICRDHPVVEKTKQFKGFTITIGRAGDFFCHFVEVKKRDHILYRDQEIGGYFYFGSDTEKIESPFRRLKPGGHLNLIFSKWTGGAHCCYSLLVFDLDDGFRIVANIEGGNFTPAFKDIDGDGIPEIEVEDDFLAYRFSSFASSAIGHVVLKLREGQYAVAPELMRKPPAFVLHRLSRKLSSWQKALRNTAAPELPQSFMQAITDLTFTGNKKAALSLIDRVWPADRPGKADFVNSYEEALSESRFYPEFEKRL